MPINQPPVRFTRKHYVSVAATLAMSRHKAVTEDAKIAVDNTVEVFADNFGWISPTFDRKTFTTAYARFIDQCANGNWSVVRGYVEGTTT